jgi:hypothetical protein
MSYTVEITKKVLEKLEQVYSQPFDKVATEATFDTLFKRLSINPFIYPTINDFRVVVGTMLSCELVYFIKGDKVVIFETLDWTDFL